MPSPWNNPDAADLQRAIERFKLDPAAAAALREINLEWTRKVINFTTSHKIHGPQMMDVMAEVVHSSARLTAGLLASTIAPPVAGPLARSLPEAFEHMFKLELESAQNHLREHMEDYDDA